jgi:hypothetical protein
MRPEYCAVSTRRDVRHARCASSLQGAAQNLGISPPAGRAKHVPGQSGRKGRGRQRNGVEESHGHQIQGTTRGKLRHRPARTRSVCCTPSMRPAGQRWRPFARRGSGTTDLSRTDVWRRRDLRAPHAKAVQQPRPAGCVRTCPPAAASAQRRDWLCIMSPPVWSALGLGCVALRCVALLAWSALNLR